MSIADTISQRLAEGRVVEHVPAVPGIGRPRRMLLPRSVQEKLDGPWDSLKDEAQCFQVRANLDNFVQGGLIAIAANTFKARTALLAQLDPPTDEVWEIRCRDPKPGIRTFGRFAAADFFVGLQWAYRTDMKSRKANEWYWMIDECQKDWAGFFHPNPPLSGVYPNDYISENFHLV